MIKIFTIVKDEIDVVREWVMYHGRIFGFNNIYVIDNMSVDGTYEKLLELQQWHGCNVSQKPNYSMKGEYMTQYIREFCNEKDSNGKYVTPIAYPIDIDEFITLYDKQTHSISCDKEQILAYFKDSILPMVERNEHVFFKANYVISKIMSDAPNGILGYNNAVMECTHGKYSDYGNFAKTFFSSKQIIEHGTRIDHGNHYMTNGYHPTSLVLVHYHARSYEQMCKKIYNNVAGFDYPVNDAFALRNYVNGSGGHHVQHRINVLNGTFKLALEQVDVNRPSSDSHIPLHPVSEFIAQCGTPRNTCNMPI